MKTKRTGLWLCLLVLITLFLLTACGEEKKQDVNADEDGIKLYWNVEKFQYSQKDVLRTTRDGQYYVRFAVDGEQVEYPVKDSLLVDYIDTMEVMGLVFDDQGVVIDALRVEEFYGSILAEDDYVTSLSKSEIICNTMGNGMGLSKTISINEKTKVYYWDEDGGVLCGLPGQLQIGSKILAVADEAGTVTHVYTRDPFAMGDVYWNHQRKYDTLTKLSTRELDELGRFVYNFSVNGEQVTLYTRDQEIANKVDAVAARCMGLSFDENGYIQDVFTTRAMTGGKSWGSWYYILDVDGKIISGEKFSGSNIGSTARGSLAADCKIYDVSGKGDYIGQPTELRLYDQVHGLRNEHGEICVLFVVGRTYQADIYYNVERKYDAVNKITKRTLAADGYYYITLAVKGEQVTLKTDNKEIVNSIDAAAARCFGLKVENGEILEFYGAGNVWGGRQFCSYDYVTEIRADGTIVCKENDVAKNGDKTYTGKMADDCGVYNVSSTAGVIGEKTTLQVGDKVHALKDWYGNVTHIFVVGRSYRVPIYWNVNRQYDSENKTTRRVPNADGYYEVVLAVNGQQKTFKTKSKSLITEIDAVATKCFGLVTSGNIIQKMYKTANVYGGAQFCSWDVVTSIKDNKVVAKEADGSKIYTDYMTKSTKVYNVTGNGEFVGEKTTLQVGDKIHALKYATGGINIIYVVSRTEKVIEETAYCQLCEKDVTWYSWDGAVAMEHGKHYFLKHSVGINKTAYIGAEDQTDMEVTLDLRGHDIRATARAFRVYGTFNLLDTVGEGVIYGNTAGQATGFYVYDAGIFNMYGGIFRGGDVANSQCGIGALGLKEGSKATFNMYGGSLSGGNTEKDGGNLTLYHSSVFNMYGGTISDGKTLGQGGNILAGAKSQINLYGGQITGGTAQTGNSIYGGQISVYPDAPVVVDDIYLNQPLHVPELLAQTSRIAVTLPAGHGVVTGQTPQENIAYIQATNGQIIYQGGKLVVRAPADRVAFCEHCQKEVEWYVWDGAFTLEDGEHYYLRASVSVSETAYIGTAENGDVSVCLDLNGQNVDATVRVFRIYGNLNLMDGAETDGIITGNTAGQASVFYVYENAVFNMYGGTMTSQKTVTSDNGAGIGGIDKGTMNLYGGKITGGVSKRSGGNLNLYNTGVLNMYGGIIENGKSLENSGGNIQMNAKSQLHIYGGSILGGSAANLGNCINANGKVTLYGNSQITVSEIYLPGTKTLVVENALAAESSIGIALQNGTGIFTGQTAEENAAFFHNDTYEVYYQNGKLGLRSPVDPNAHYHCVCGGLGAKGDHTECTDVEWTPWPGADALTLDGSVYYYLTQDITVDKVIKLEEGQILNLCLNGHSITTTANIYIFDVYGELNLCDHPNEDGSYSGAVTNLYSGKGHTRAFELRSPASVAKMNIFGGNFSAPNAQSTGTGSTVARVGSSTGKCVFKLYAGTIFGGKASSMAISGNITFESGSTGYLYGGLITGGSNDKGAGNVILKNGASLTLDGGSITNGTGIDGGNVRVNSGCTLAIISGAVTGGSIYAAGTVTVSENATVDEIITP